MVCMIGCKRTMLLVQLHIAQMAGSITSTTTLHSIDKALIDSRERK